MDARQRERYSRQILLPQIGAAGQQKLLASRAVVVGCGALGTVQATLLVRAGVGEVALIDRDYVEESNLQRQWLFDESDVEQGLPKAAAAANHLGAASSSTSVTAYVDDLTPENAERLLTPANVVLDGTDNFAARYLINDVAVKNDIPWVYGAAVGTQGSWMPIVPRRTACLTCIFPAAPEANQPTCDTAGVLGSTTTLVAARQVTEAIKLLCGASEELRTKLNSTNLWTGEQSAIRTDRPRADCRTCGERNFEHLNSSGQGSASLCGRNAVQVRGNSRRIDLPGLASALTRLGEVRLNDFALRFINERYEITVFQDGRAIVKGTNDLAAARSLYARYVGQ